MRCRVEKENNLKNRGGHTAGLRLVFRYSSHIGGYGRRCCVEQWVSTPIAQRRFADLPIFSEVILWYVVNRPSLNTASRTPAGALRAIVRVGLVGPHK